MRRISYFVELILLGIFLPYSNSMAVNPERIPCVQNLEMHFFQESMVTQALSLYQVPQGLWSPLTLELQAAGRSILTRMELKTAQMNPNPIEYPMQKLATAQILKATLYEVFMEVIARYQATDQLTANQIFNYILAAQSANFISCFGEEARSLLPSF